MRLKRAAVLHASSFGIRTAHPSNWMISAFTRDACYTGWFAHGLKRSRLAKSPEPKAGAARQVNSITHAQLDKEGTYPWQYPRC